ncbi:myb-like protein P isoform X1 [Lucilia cuprina]|uniref:myb-like protein P isoform X1 n=1 Tax=Lucilia cuprina TaxID=7375 RepID=UPI001F0561D1|nr:myb-like protein P isoform X1 [Lucilia cuprina]
MLRKFLKPTVIASILILLTILTTITKATAVTTSTTSIATPTTTITPIPSPPPPTTTATATPSTNISATVFPLTKTSVVNKFLNNAAEETTTSLLPLQPPLNVTSTTLASFILNQKHQQQQRQRKQQQLLYLQQQRQHRQVQDVEEITQEEQHEQQQQQQQQHLLNDNVNDNKEIIKKNLDSSFVTVTSPVDVITPEPSSTHAYIPFDLDYNDPTEEKALKETTARQSTINEVLTNLFPKGFSDIFRFSYAGEQEAPSTTTTTSTTAAPIKVVKSTPTPFKPMPSTKTKKKEKAELPSNGTFITVSTTVTREIRREISPGHTEIVVEKIITDPGSIRSSEEFRDGSNSISKDELLRINRAAKEASVLPSLLVNPQSHNNNNLTDSKTLTPIVILNENYNNDDFVDAPEDDNQIAETQDVIHQVVQAPPAESTNYHVTPNHQYNVRIIHDNTLKNAQDNELAHPTLRNFPSYQTFVEQSKHLQNSLNEAPSRTFLKNFQNPILSQNVHSAAVNKGSFHYEQPPTQSHIQTVLPAAQLQYAQYQNHHQQLPQAEALQQAPSQAAQYQQQHQLHTQITASQHASDKDIYQIDSDQQQQLEHATEANIVFVTINTPIAHTIQQTPKLVQTYSQEPQILPPQPMKSPHEFVADAMAHNNHEAQQLVVDHQAQQTENNPKPSNTGYTYVEVQKSINIHNKLITEKDGRLIEQHETIYPPEQKYTHHIDQQQEPVQPQPSPDYVSLSQNPIHVEQEEEQYESAASIKDEQHTLNPSQDLSDFDTIQQSNLVQETHIIETPQHDQQVQTEQVQYEQQHAQEQNNHEQYDQHYAQEQQVQYQQPANDHNAQYEQYHVHEQQVQYQQSDNPQQQQVQYQQIDNNHQAEEGGHHHIEEEEEGDHKIVEEQQLNDEIQSQPANVAYEQTVQIPYALPETQPYQRPQIIEKHIPVPYGVPEPVGIPVHIEHYIDRPFPVETIVEKPVPYPVEKVVEKFVEKHVPIEVEKIVEKPVEVIVKKYIDRPVAIPIKIPVALHLPASPHGPPFGHYPPTFAGVSLDHASTWPQTVNGGSFSRIPQSVVKAYYAKMLKKLVPQMQQAYKNTHATKAVPKITPKPFVKQTYKISDILYDLKPPPPRPKGVSSNWDVGARYQYDYNTLPLDLSASSSIAVGKHMERPGQGYKNNFDEFQRWRNGHSLKRSPDFGRNLHVEYGFKPPLVPSVEIDDKGVPKRKEE